MGGVDSYHAVHGKCMVQNEKTRATIQRYNMHVLVYLIQKPVCESFVYQFLYLPNMGKQSASSIAIAGEVFLRPLQILYILFPRMNPGESPKSWCNSGGD